MINRARPGQPEYTRRKQGPLARHSTDQICLQIPLFVCGRRPKPKCSSARKRLPPYIEKSFLTRQRAVSRPWLPSCFVSAAMSTVIGMGEKANREPHGLPTCRLITPGYMGLLLPLAVQSTLHGKGKVQVDDCIFPYTPTMCGPPQAGKLYRTRQSSSTAPPPGASGFVFIVIPNVAGTVPKPEWRQGDLMN